MFVGAGGGGVGASRRARPTCTLPTHSFTVKLKVWARREKPLHHLQGSFVFQAWETTLKLKNFQGLEAPLRCLQGAPDLTFPSVLDS